MTSSSFGNINISTMMKKTLISITLALSLIMSFALPTLPAYASYKPHEHVFYHSKQIKSMKQIVGNGFCRTKFKQLKATGDLGGGFNPKQVNHVWAHVKNGDCVANT